jgi:uncharacterized protein (TIGR00369 family)
MRRTVATDKIPFSQNLLDFRHQLHPRCVVCGPFNPWGLRVDFQALSDGSVTAAFDCREVLEGYADILHGGVIASLLDGAMTNCLFAHGLIGVTAKLTIRFQRPVLTNRSATVRAWIEDSFLGVSRLGADLRQEGQVMATATAKFMPRPEWAGQSVTPSTAVEDGRGGGTGR